MADTTKIREILEIKTAATRCSTKLETIVDIKNGWDADDEDLSECALAIGLECNNAIVECQEVVMLCDELLSALPPYEPLRHRILELDVLCWRAAKHISTAEVKLESLRAETTYSLEMRMIEAELRTKDAGVDIEQMTGSTQKVLKADTKGNMGDSVGAD